MTPPVVRVVLRLHAPPGVLPVLHAGLVALLDGADAGMHAELDRQSGTVIVSSSRPRSPGDLDDAIRAAVPSALMAAYQQAGL